MVVDLAPARSSNAYRSVEAERRLRFVPGLTRPRNPGRAPLARLKFLVAFAVLAASCTGVSSSPTTADASIGVVEFVIDGDTVDLIIDGQEERARLIGIDTPETVSESTPVQCYGEEASQALKGLLPIGTEVRLTRDDEARDRFGRLLVYIHRAEDDLFVNRWLVESGFADALFFEPNTTFEREFTQLRNKARSEAVGLWGQCDGPDQPLE